MRNLIIAAAVLCLASPTRTLDDSRTDRTRRRFLFTSTPLGGALALPISVVAADLKNTRRNKPSPGSFQKTVRLELDLSLDINGVQPTLPQ